MKRPLPRWAQACSVALLLVCGGAMAHERADGLDHEHVVKARYLFNLTRFVEWPPSAFEGPTTPFRVCVFGSGGSDAWLDAFAGRRVQGHPVVVERIEADATAPNCQIAFFARGPATQARTPAMGAELKGTTLTVADDPRFARHGGMVALVSAQGRVRLHLNLASIGASSLRVSAKLMEVAEVRHRVREPRG